MTTYVALLRAVNVGGTGKLSMKDLVALCGKLGFEDVCTYIQSGNVVFRSALPPALVRQKLEQALSATMGKQTDVMLRTAAEMRAIQENNPFAAEPPNKVAVMFLSKAVPENAAEEAVTPDGEQVGLGKREIYVYFPNNMGRSKLKLPRSLGATTARNMNTVAKLVRMAEQAGKAR